MKSIHPRQIFLATVSIFGAISLSSMLPTQAQNSPSTPDSQLPPVSPTTPNSPTTPTSSPQTPNSTTTPTQRSTPTRSTYPTQNNPTKTNSQPRPTSPTQTGTPTQRSTPNSTYPTPNNPTKTNSQTRPTSPTQTATPTQRSTPNSTTPNLNNPTNTNSQPRPTSSTPSSGQGSNSSSLNAVDRQFATKAAQSDLFEIQTSQLAIQRSQNPQILSYARQMIQEHTNSTNKLKPIAARLNLALPNTLAAEDRPVVNQLSRLSGTQFDRAYMNGQTQGHAKTQALYQTQLQQGQNSQLKAFASEILPVVSMHLEMVRNMTAMR
jgi:putative membrane protein